MRTVPVNQSAGPLLEGCEPILLISILSFFHYFLFGFYLLASLTAPGVLAETGSHSRPHPPAGGWRRRRPRANDSAGIAIWAVLLRTASATSGSEMVFNSSVATAPGLVQRLRPARTEAERLSRPVRCLRRFPSMLLLIMLTPACQVDRRRAQER